MTVAIAETDVSIFQDLLPATYVAQELSIDAELRLRASQFIGSVVSGEAVNVESLPSEGRIATLHEAISRANEGDKEARRMVETNVGTDVIERTIKTGHVMKKVPLGITSGGKLLQHGQAMDSIQANSLQYASNHPIMRARTEAEVRNMFRIEQYAQEGWFDNYSLLVISRAENLPDQGFFTDTMSCSLQLIDQDGTGLSLESAFVAGIAAAGQKAHDAETTVKLGAALGADYQGLTPAEIIDRPILIRKDLIRNGVIDVVKMWDIISGTFFGENRPPEDYISYRAMCHEREKLFGPKVQQITQELISAAPQIHSPVEASRLLNDLSGHHMVEQAIKDKTIDSRVFGWEAARYIDDARQAIARGDVMAIEELTHKAMQTERSSSCPSGMMDSKIGETTVATANEDDDCVFTSRQCPVCKTKNVRTVVQKLASSGRKRISGSCGCVKVA